jgi:hypothetical protein
MACDYARFMLFFAGLAFVTGTAGVARPPLERHRRTNSDTVLTVNNAANYISPEDAHARLNLETAGQSKRIIAMSLYGNATGYLIGAVENAVLVQRDWSGWTLRVYHDAYVPANTLRVLRDLQTELVPKSSAHVSDHAGLLWRYTVLQDSSVTRFIVRDADARLSRRDRHAVDEWIQSGHLFHVVRDHPWHGTEIMGGIWGAVGGLIKPEMLQPFISSTAEIRFYEDQFFLKKYVWPHVRAHALTHDSYLCENPGYKTAEWRPFPTQRLLPNDFIGNKYMRDTEYMGGALVEDCPAACRAQVDWTMC